jgi:uncharacterized protein (DUF1330 family)
MGNIKPTKDQMTTFLETTITGPVHMLNLLKFTRSEAGGSGKSQYGDYGSAVITMIEERGGKVVWSGRPFAALIGDNHDDWDLAVVIEYPSKDAFIEMTSNPAYAKISGDRSGSLANSALIPCRPL